MNDEFKTRFDREKIALDSMRVIGIAKATAVCVSSEDGYKPVKYETLLKQNDNRNHPFTYPYLKRAKRIARHLGFWLEDAEILKPKKPLPLIIRLSKESETIILIAPRINGVGRC